MIASDVRRCGVRAMAGAGGMLAASDGDGPSHEAVHFLAGAEAGENALRFAAESVGGGARLSPSCCSMTACRQTGRRRDATVGREPGNRRAETNFSLPAPKHSLRCGRTGRSGCVGAGESMIEPLYLSRCHADCRCGRSGLRSVGRRGGHRCRDPRSGAADRRSGGLKETQ